MSKEELALAMVALKHALDRIRPAQDELRADARELLGKKERVPALIDGQVVGTIGKSSPKKVARVSDAPALLAWIEQNYPEHLDAVPYIEHLDAAIRFLEEHGPTELVQYRTVVAEPTLRVMLKASETVGSGVGPGGEADVPGITVDTPDGNVTVLMEKGNEYLVEQLFTSGVVSLDGAVRKQIGASDGVR